MVIYRAAHRLLSGINLVTPDISSDQGYGDNAMGGDNCCLKCGGLGKLISSNEDVARYECYDVSHPQWTVKSKIGDAYDLNDAISDMTSIWNEVEQDYNRDGGEVLSYGCSDFRRYKQETIKILKRLANVSTGEES